MTKTSGLFLCIEGGDGSGKGTQYEMLLTRLRALKRPVLALDFPQYGQPSAELVERYLRNEFGTATKIDPRLASLPYAIDRLAAKPKIEQAIGNGKLVLANRFTASNMAHQGAKLTNQVDRVAFFSWLRQLEHEIMGIPEPNQHYVLHVPAAIARKRVLQKTTRSYTNKKLDSHEADLAYQRRAEQTYLDLVKTFPANFEVIECIDGTRAKTPGEVHAEIWQRVKELIHA